MLSKLTPEERSDNLTPIERFGCQPFDETHSMPGRCYFFIGANCAHEPLSDEVDRCAFPFAANWAKDSATCDGGHWRHCPIKIEDLATCPLSHIGAAHLADVNAPYRHVQRGPFRVRVHNGRIEWNRAERWEDVRKAEIKRHCNLFCPDPTYLKSQSL